MLNAGILHSMNLRSIGAKDDAMETWRDLVAQQMTAPEDHDEFE
jgi:hypothetical protein